MTAYAKTRGESGVENLSRLAAPVEAGVKLPDIYERVKQSYLHPSDRVLVFSKGLILKPRTYPNPWDTTNGTDIVRQGELDLSVFTLAEITNTMPLKIEVVQQGHAHNVGLKCDEKMVIQLPFGFWKTVKVDYVASVPLLPPAPFIKNPYGVIEVISGPSLFGPSGAETTQETAIVERPIQASAISLKSDPGIRRITIEPAPNVEFHVTMLICSG